MHLVMFDIDGTLVDSDEFDGELYVAAVEAETGVVVHRDWDRYEHVSDSGILAQVLREARRDAECDELAARVQWRFIGLVRDCLRRNPTAVREIAGARQLVDRLLALPQVRVAVATGGWAETARLKLEHVGIDAAARVCEQLRCTRAHGHHAARGAARDAWGAVHACDLFRRPPVDRRASVELGYDFIAVGGAVQHRPAYPDLKDTEAIVAQLALSANEGVARHD
jgi:hypothetical protein